MRRPVRASWYVSFGGWDFTAADAQNRLPAAVGYTKGVPMGGDLSGKPNGKSPTFLVAALKDPLSGNLDRIQIIKGWVDAKGARHEKVYDVAWGDADKRKPGPDGKLPPVGNTVDVAKATWTNTIGTPELLSRVERPGFRSQAAGRLLCTRGRNSDTALDRLRGHAVWRQDVEGGPDDHPGAGLHIAHMVFTLSLSKGTP